MASVEVMPAQDLQPGNVREVIIEARSYAICNTAGQFYAVSGDCPHRNGPLGHGALHGYDLLCPWHLWDFDIRTGRSSAAPDCIIATYPVTVENGTVCIQLSNA